MERYEAAMAIARINMISKKTAQAVKLCCIQDIEDAMECDESFNAIADSVIRYMKTDRDPILYNQVLCYVNMDESRKFADSLVDEELKAQIVDLSDAIDRMRELAKQQKEESRLHPKLIDELADKETETLLMRAVNSGVLDENFMPAKGTKIYQLKLIAMAVNTIKGTKVRNRWCHFEDQWNIGEQRLSKAAVPITRGRDIYRIAKLYPEVDFNQEIDTRAIPVSILKSPLNEAQALKLCHLLKTKGFLDREVDDSSFLAIQGLAKIPPQPVNWVGQAYALAYLMKALYSDLNANIWNLTVKWFTVRNESLNRETFKTKSHILEVHADRYSFIPVIDRLIRKAKDIK